MKAILALEDGTIYEGESIGAPGTTVGEAVFSTGMTGYQEALTDPSFAGQILTQTYPLIGNYGVNPEDFESDRVQVAGYVVRQLCERHSNWRSTQPLGDFLAEHKVIGIQKVDTRAVTRRLRTKGVMMGGISTELTSAELLEAINKSPDYGEIDFVRQVSTSESYVWEPSEPDKSAVVHASGQRIAQGPGTLSYRVNVNAGRLPQSERRELNLALVDLGVKRSIMKHLAALGCRIQVLPCSVTADEILDLKTDGVVFSPGPGDPERLGWIVENLKDLIGKTPILGICLGHQALGWAAGSRTFKLKFGHRGGNHPVHDLTTDKVSITSQNHGYAVDPKGLEGSGFEVSHINLNDGTVEGLRHKEYPIISMQYHPESSPGPWDSDFLFRRFVDLVRQNS